MDKSAERERIRARIGELLKQFDACYAQARALWNRGVPNEHPSVQRWLNEAEAIDSRITELEDDLANLE